MVQILGACLTALALVSPFTTLAVPQEQHVIVIAHRGASGHLPEHTLAAYAFGYASGAEFIEPDLVMTADGVLIARHEPLLNETTNVAEVFPERADADGHYYAADFTWAEIQRLRAIERVPGRFPREHALFPIPRFEEILALVDGLNAVTGCSVGLYPELKGSEWHRARRLDPVAAFRDVLVRQPFEAPIFLQSFEAAPLREVAEAPIEGVRLIQLLGRDIDVGPEGLAEIAAYADGVGPWMGQLLDGQDDLVARARSLGLLVHTWTLRTDQLGPFEDFDAMVHVAASELAVDGIFTDHPADALRALGRRSENARSCSSP